MATPVIMPKQGQSVESCIINEWYVKKGQAVKKGDLLFSYETDKASFEEEAPVDGTLLEIFYESGSEVPVLFNVAVIGKKGENIDEYKPDKQKPVVRATEEKVLPQIKTNDTDLPSPKTQDGTIKISPRAKKLADKMNVDYRYIAGSGPEGRIIEKDIENHTKSNPLYTKLGMEIQRRQEAYTLGAGIGGRITSSEITPVYSFNDDVEIKKLTNTRKIIAKNMQASLQNSAQLTHHLSADARKLIEYRNKVKKLSETKKIENITLNDMVCYAVIKALKQNPEINSHFLADSIKTFKKVHLGFAVQTERGLMVPTLRDADDLSIEELSRQFKLLAESCKKGNVNPELLASTSASFTVSNLGSYGIEMFTPVLNLPQSGILGVNAIINRPFDNGKGKITLIPYIGLSLTYDHRALDGAPASAFLKEVKEQIEKIELHI